MDARCAGLSGEQFWRLTLRELWLELEAGLQRDRREFERDVQQAWLNEYMARQKELNGACMTKLLRQRRGPQTVTEQRAVVASIAAHFGLKTTFRPPGATTEGPLEGATA